MAKSFTYSGDPAKSSRDAVRFIIGDVFKARPMFADGEIDFQLTQIPNTKLAGAELLDIKARQFARMADIRVGEVSKSFSQVAKQMKACAKQLRDDAVRLVKPFFGGLTVSGKRQLNLDTDAVQPSFPIGITDNPFAVQLNRDFDKLIGLAGIDGI